mmetsp:Transcript_18693/g.31401  ORF Transcript_18693/g.31401 Transcript_18693/m.31401 type:complete len:254 (-) Transcript_18693:169-930(-)
MKRRFHLAGAVVLGVAVGGELLCGRAAPKVRALALPKGFTLGVGRRPSQDRLLRLVGVADGGDVGGEGGQHVAHEEFRARQQEHVHRRLEDLPPRSALDEVRPVAVVLVFLVAAVVGDGAVLLKVLVRVRPLAVGGQEDGHVPEALRLKDLARQLPLVQAHVRDGLAHVLHVVHPCAADALALQPAQVHRHVLPVGPAQPLLAERLHLGLDVRGGLDVLPEERGGVGGGAHGHEPPPRTAPHAQHRVVPRLRP